MLIRYPKLLARRNPDIKLLLPSAVLSEMAKGPFIKKEFNDRAMLIELAEQKNLVQAVPMQPTKAAGGRLADAG